MNAKQFITENWVNTIRQPLIKEGRIPLPKPFTVPCINEGFNNFYYWDSYFTNVGLMLSGKLEQARNNIENFAHCINTVGYMPNADHIKGRSQPPLFGCAIDDYYEVTKDENLAKEFAETLEKELLFWQTERTDESGLSFYFHSTDKELIPKFYHNIKKRVDLDTDNEEVAFYDGINLLAIAESGWDFTHRFVTEKSVVDAQSFYQIDLNCILYKSEKVCGKLYSILGNTKKANLFNEKAEKRKELIEKFMLCPDGIFRDYNKKDNKVTSFTSCASFLPYFVGISTDKKAYEKLVGILEQNEGIAATEKIENGYQWDFPSMWPPLVYFAIKGGENCGATATVERLAKKYLTTADRVFEMRGQLYEKYDSVTGVLPEKSEYGTPPMMGWTAATYLYLDKNYRK